MLKLAMNAGIFGTIWEGIKSIVGFVINFVDILKGLFQALIIYLYAPFYYLHMGICSIVNFAEMLFKKFAGIDPIMTNDGPMNILDVFVKSNEIWGLFVSILVLSIVLLFLFTIIAVIKSEFALDAKGSAKGPIIARSLKSLAMFVIVPVVSLLGIYATNAITDTINSMMQGSDETTMVNQIFYAMSYNANKARINREFAAHINGFSDHFYNEGGSFRNDNAGKFKGDQEQVAYLIDQAFKTDQAHSAASYRSLDLFGDKSMLEAQDFSTLLMPIGWSTISTYSIWDLIQVNYYFSILEMDYVVGLTSAVVITYLLLSMVVVLVKRIFEIVILLLLAAPMIALAPLDGGNASKSWQKEFIKRVISIVAPVFAINMYFIMIPLFMKISIFNGGLGNISAMGSINMSALGVIPLDPGTAAAYDATFQLLAVCVGMSVVKTASALLCNLLGIEDLVKSGQEATKKAVSAAVQVAGMVASGGAMAAAKGASMAAKMGSKKAGKTLKNSEKDVTSARNELKAAQDSGDQEKIAAAEAKVSKAEKTRDTAANEFKAARAKQDRAATVSKEKSEAFMETVAPNAFKGFKNAKDTWKNRDQTKAEKAANDEMKSQEAKYAAEQMMNEKYGAVNKDTGKRSGGKEDHKYDKDVVARKAEGQVEGHYDATINKNKEDLKQSNEAVSALEKELEGARTVALALGQDLQQIKNKDVSTMTRGQKDEHTRKQDAAEARFNAQMGDIQAGEELLDEESARQEKLKKENAAAKKSKKKALKAIKKGGVDLEEDAYGNIGATAHHMGAKQIAGDAAKSGAKSAATGMMVGTTDMGAGAVIAAGKIIADNIQNKQMQTGAAAINQAKTENDRVAQSIDEKRADNLQQALNNEAQKVEADIKSMNMDGMSEEVQQGLHEAAGDLANKIKESLTSAKLSIEKLDNIAATLSSIKAHIDTTNNGNDDSGQELINALKELSQKLDKLQ